MKKNIRLLFICFLITTSSIAQVSTDPNGNVGIGITPPMAKLHVNGGQIIETTGSTTNSRTLTLLEKGTNQVFFGAYSGAWRSSIQIQNNNGSKALFMAPPDLSYNYAIFRAVNGGMKFDVGGDLSNEGTKAVTIETNGNVGIGTITPQQKLDILGTLRFGNHSSQYVDLYLQDGDDYTETGYAAHWPDMHERAFMIKPTAYLDGWGAGGAGIQFYTYDIAGGSSPNFTGGLKRAMVIRRNGNVGIGTASPEANLHVEGRSYIRTNDDDVLTFDNTDDSWQYIQFKGNGVRKTWMGLDNHNNFNIYKEKGGAILFGGGNVGIGTSNVNDPNYRLFVETGIRTRKVKVDLTNWADYVFEPTYRLLPLTEVERFIQQNKHLPEVPTAIEVERDGVDLGENQVLLLKKIEELTLYAIEAEKVSQDLKVKNQKQQEQINLLEERLKKLEDKLK